MHKPLNTGAIGATGAQSFSDAAALAARAT
jgi:hypothetical protein